MPNFDPDKSAKDEKTKKEAAEDLKKKRKISFGKKVGGGATSAIERRLKALEDAANG